MASDLSYAEIEAGMREIQDHIAFWLVKAAKGQEFRQDVWSYDKGDGGGRTRVWESTSETDVLEKAGVNFSSILGSQLPKASLAVLPTADQAIGFKATGVSLVIHPANPHAPTIHMNVRYLENGDSWWFGGGIDLTPYYPTFGQAKAFHAALRKVCEDHDQPYEEYKTICDDYFTLKHRKEMRGIGGIFFEHLKSKPKSEIFAFVKALGFAFTSIYEACLVPNIDKPWTPEEKEYQLWRRSRYVEFNLLWDRGTKFGIESEGRTESILMSLPTVCKWYYDFRLTPGTREAITHSFYLHPQDWTNLEESAVPVPTTQFSDFTAKVAKSSIVASSKPATCCFSKCWSAHSKAGALLAVGFVTGIAATVGAMKLYCWHRRHMKR